jgi:hypothetical protein
MAGQFSASEWQAVANQLAGRAAQYGLPERREGSIVFASWNIRKFGALHNSRGQPSNSPGAYAHIAEFCSRCDLISIQEVQESLESVRRLVDDLNAPLPQAPYRLIVSDVTGQEAPGEGLAERMAFVYDTRRISLGQVVSDVSLDLRAIVAYANAAIKDVSRTLQRQNPQGMMQAIVNWFQQITPFQQDKLESFLQFIRSPYLATFRVAGNGGAAYDIACIDAHLLYGKPRQREREFFALLRWMALRANQSDDRLDAPVLMLLGDCNLDFQSSNDKRRAAIETFIVDINHDNPDSASRLNLPFLDKHDGRAEPFFTNARKNETFDQIGWFSRDDRFPRGHHNKLAGTLGPDGYDYGMFDFVSLFLDAGLIGSPGAVDYARFEYDLSDHMPIWVRFQLPDPGQPRFQAAEHPVPSQ